VKHVIAKNDENRLCKPRAGACCSSDKQALLSTEAAEAALSGSQAGVHEHVACWKNEMIQMMKSMRALAGLIYRDSLHVPTTRVCQQPQSSLAARVPHLHYQAWLGLDATILLQHLGLQSGVHWACLLMVWQWKLGGGSGKANTFSQVFAHSKSEE
jgi:hypothetical protein